VQDFFDDRSKLAIVPHKPVRTLLSGELSDASSPDDEFKIQQVPKPRQ
jgi:hypothetical protein